MIDIDKFICSLIKRYCDANFIDRSRIRCWLDDVLEDCGVECKDGVLVPIEKPSTIKFNEPDIDEMVEDFILSNEASGELKSSDVISYRQGLEDMYRKLK